MTQVMAAALAIVLGAEIDVPAGAPLPEALARARPGDVVRLGRGTHQGALGRVAGLRFVGAGSGETVVVAPEGEDGVVASGVLDLAGLTLRAGPEHCALKVFGGQAKLEDVVLAGGSCGAYVDAGRLSARGIALSGASYGLLVREGNASLDDGSVHGGVAGVAVLGGAVALRRLAVTGPSREAGISIAGGAAALEAVVIRSPGPAGIAVSGGARVEATDLTVAGAVEEGGFLGDCIQVIRGTLRLTGGTLVRCAGTAAESSGGEIRLGGVDAAGGEAGCLVFLNGAVADLTGNLCVGRGPGLVVSSHARVRLVANRWWTDPVLWADCGSGARVEIGWGERMKRPCAAIP